MPSKIIFLKISIVLALAMSGGFGCANITLAQSSKDTDVALAQLGFTRSLSLGMRGNDVRYLQEFLAKDPKIYPEGQVTGVFGPRTREAVKKWQQKNGLDAVGIVGPKTIAKLKEIGRAAVLESPQSLTPAPPATPQDTTTTPKVLDDTTPPSVTLTLSIPAPTSIYIESNPSKEVTAVYEYGLTTRYGSIQETTNQYFSSPTGTYLENLTPATTYQIRAKVADRSGNVGYSQNYTFTTPSLDQAPIISSGPSVTSSAAKPAVSVAVSWSTNIACTGTLHYGADATFGNAQSSGYAIKHTAIITGLAPGASYIYKITCATAKKTVESSNFLFIATSSASSSVLNNISLANILQTLEDLIQKILFK